MATDDPRVTPPSGRTTVRRGAKRAGYEPSVIQGILRAGSVAHVGVQTGEGPLVLPMAYGVTDDIMYLHGAVANALLKEGTDTEICATVTILDGLVIAKTPFNHSMNYRSVVVRGIGRVVRDEQEILDALEIITDHIVPTWSTTRPPSAAELKATRVLALPLAEASAKVRTGPPVNEPEDATAPYWTGVVPVVTTLGAPVAAADSIGDTPTAITALESRDLHTPSD